MEEQNWQSDAQVAPGIERISSGADTAWFLPDGDVADLTSIWPGCRRLGAPRTDPEAVAAGDDHRACVNGRVADRLGWPAQPDARGIIVPRFRGGLLADALRGYGGLTSGQSLAVLGACVEALVAAPAPADGRVRCHRSAFAVDADGAILLIPGHTLPRADISCEAHELGQLAYLALTGLTWEESGVPVRDLQPPVPEALAGLVIELLEAEDSEGLALDTALLARVAAAGTPEPIPFVPAEAEVSVSEAVTAQLRVDARLARERSRGRARSFPGAEAAHHGRTDHGRTDDGQPARGPAAAGQGITRLRQAAGQGDRSRGSGRPGRGRPGASRQDRGWIGRLRLPKLGRVSGGATRRGRMSLAGLVGLAAAVLLCGAGAALLTGLFTPAGSPQAAAQHSAGTPSGNDATPPAVKESPSASAATASGAGDPAAAFSELTAARAAAYEAGDAAALARLTVPGSPAAGADRSADVEQFAGYDVSIAVDEAAVTRHDDTTALLDVTTRTSASDPSGAGHDFGRTRMRVELRLVDGTWRVYDALTR